jgi:hypothetical protein
MTFKALSNVVTTRLTKALERWLSVQQELALPVRSHPICKVIISKVILSKVIISKVIISKVIISIVVMLMGAWTFNRMTLNTKTLSRIENVDTQQSSKTLFVSVWHSAECHFVKCRGTCIGM